MHTAQRGWYVLFNPQGLLQRSLFILLSWDRCLLCCSETAAGVSTVERKHVCVRPMEIRIHCKLEASSICSIIVCAHSLHNIDRPSFSRKTVQTWTWQRTSSGPANHVYSSCVIYVLDWLSVWNRQLSVPVVIKLRGTNYLTKCCCSDVDILHPQRTVQSVSTIKYTYLLEGSSEITTVFTVNTRTLLHMK